MSFLIARMGHLVSSEKNEILRDIKKLSLIEIE